MGFDWAYRSGEPPWDIGGPQPAIVRLVAEGAIEGAVLDVGCGTGENALYLASRGLDVVGIDAAPTAIARARDKAAARDLRVEFRIADALALDGFGRAFDVAIDCGLFHTFSDADRVRFERSLHATLRPGSRYFVLCFNEHEHGDLGPRRVTEREIRETFARRWTVDSIVEERFATRLGDEGASAWLASLRRS
jgi:cyclopropane fatty-acyl-phospholipid synthase-like methyltransferase